MKEIICQVKIGKNVREKIKWLSKRSTSGHQGGRVGLRPNRIRTRMDCY